MGIVPGINTIQQKDKRLPNDVLAPSGLWTGLFPSGTSTFIGNRVPPHRGAGARQYHTVAIHFTAKVTPLCDDTSPMETCTATSPVEARSAGTRAFTCMRPG
jgi:hypothetical protein